MLASAKAAHGPSGAVGGASRFGAEQQAGLLEGLADRGERQRARLGGARPLHAAHQLRLGARIERRADRHLPVGGIDPAAGKHELAGHEDMAVMALAEQHLRRLARCGRAGSASRRRAACTLGWPGSALRVGEAFGRVGHRRAFPSRFCLGTACRGGARCGSAARDARTAARCAPRHDAAFRSSSKRSAPATGAASTSLTVTRSPSR